MTILLMILKIIGIVLLCILGFLIVLLLCVLFVPVRYHAKGAYHDTLSMRAGFSWLLHILSVRMTFGEDGNLVIRLFGIPIYDRNRKAAREKRRSRRKKASSAKKATIQTTDINKTRKKDDIKNKHNASKHNEESTAEKTADIPEDNFSEDTFSEDDSTENIDSENYVNTDNEEETSGFIAKCKIFFEFVVTKLKMLWKAIRNIEYTFHRLYDRIMKAVQKIHFYKTVWERPETQRAFQTCKKHLWRIFKNIKPRKTRICVTFGMDDPAVTADILSVYSVLYPWIGNSVMVTPDFEEVKIKADFYTRGYVTVYFLICAVWAYLFDRDIKRLKRCLNRRNSSGR